MRRELPAKSPIKFWLTEPATGRQRQTSRLSTTINQLGGSLPSQLKADDSLAAEFGAIINESSGDRRGHLLRFFHKNRRREIKIQTEKTKETERKKKASLGSKRGREFYGRMNEWGVSEGRGRGLLEFVVRVINNQEIRGWQGTKRL